MIKQNQGYSQEKSTLKLNSSAYEKYEYGHLGRWYIKLIFLRGSKTEANFQKNKVVTGKTPLFVIGPFVLTLASDRAVLNGNDVFQS